MMKIGGNPVYFGYDIFGNMFGELDMDGEPITTYIYLGNHRLAMLGGTVTGSFGCNLGQKAVESAKANWAIIIILPVIVILALKYRKNKYVVSLLVVIGGSAIILIAMNEARSDLEYSEAIYFYHNDHLGTPQVMTDISGTVKWDVAYEPFGKIKTQYINQPITNRFRFPGQYEDDMTGMYYNHHRYYMPEVGSYNRIDPLGWVNFYNKNKLYYIKYGGKQYGINPYRYYLHNPTNYHNYNYAINEPIIQYDPNGENPLVIISVILIGVIVVEVAVVPNIHLINDGLANLIDEHFGTPPTNPSLQLSDENEPDNEHWHLEPCTEFYENGPIEENSPAGSGGGRTGPAGGK